jgi:hypothetical protein
VLELFTAHAKREHLAAHAYQPSREQPNNRRAMHGFATPQKMNCLNAYVSPYRVKPCGGITATGLSEQSEFE